jgi:hypothetical protein
MIGDSELENKENEQGKAVESGNLESNSTENLLADPTILFTPYFSGREPSADLTCVDSQVVNKSFHDSNEHNVSKGCGDSNGAEQSLLSPGPPGIEESAFVNNSEALKEGMSLLEKQFAELATDNELKDSLSPIVKESQDPLVSHQSEHQSEHQNFKQLLEEIEDEIHDPSAYDFLKSNDSCEADVIEEELYQPDHSPSGGEQSEKKKMRKKRKKIIKKSEDETPLSSKPYSSSATRESEKRPKSRFNNNISAEEGFTALPLKPYHSELMEGKYERPVVVSILAPEKYLRQRSSFAAPDEVERRGRSRSFSPTNSQKSLSVSPHHKFQDSEILRQSICDFSIQHDSLHDFLPDDENKEKIREDAPHSPTPQQLAINRKMKYFVIKVNDLVASREASYTVILRDFQQLLDDLVKEYETTEVNDFYQPYQLHWWKKHLSKVCLVFDRPNGQLSIVVDKKLIKKLIKKQMDHYYWMKDSLNQGSAVKSRSWDESRDYSYDTRAVSAEREEDLKKIIPRSISGNNEIRKSIEFKSTKNESLSSKKKNSELVRKSQSRSEKSIVFNPPLEEVGKNSTNEIYKGRVDNQGIRDKTLEAKKSGESKSIAGLLNKDELDISGDISLLEDDRRKKEKTKKPKPFVPERRASANYNRPTNPKTNELLLIAYGKPKKTSSADDEDMTPDDPAAVKSGELEAVPKEKANVKPYRKSTIRSSTASQPQKRRSVESTLIPISDAKESEQKKSRNKSQSKPESGSQNRNSKDYEEETKLPAISVSNSNNSQQSDQKSLSYSPKNIFRISNPYSFAFMETYQQTKDDATEVASSSISNHLELPNIYNKNNHSPATSPPTTMGGSRPLSPLSPQIQSYASTVYDDSTNNPYAVAPFDTSYNSVNCDALLDSHTSDMMNSSLERLQAEKRSLSPFDSETVGVKGSAKVAADIIMKARKTVSSDAKFHTRKVSFSEMKLLSRLVIGRFLFLIFTDILVLSLRSCGLNLKMTKNC